MGFDQFLVGEVETGPSHRPFDHFLARPEKVLIVSVSLAAEGQDQRGLAAAPGTPAALSVVRWSRRYVTHMDGIKIVYVDAQLHRRCAAEHRQTPIAKFLLSINPFLRPHRTGMGLGMQSNERARSSAIESVEESIRGSLREMMPAQMEMAGADRIGPG